MLLKCSISMVLIWSLLPWCKISNPFRKNNNVVVLVLWFPFHIFEPLANFSFIRFQGQFSILRKSFPDLYPFIRPPRMSLSLGGGRILIAEFIRCPTTLAVYDLTHCLPPAGVCRSFSFAEDETRRHFSYHSSTFREIFLETFVMSENWNEKTLYSILPYNSFFYVQFPFLYTRIQIYKSMLFF